MTIRRSGRYIKKTLVALLGERICSRGERIVCKKKRVNTLSKHIHVYENFLKLTVLILLV